MNDFSSHSIAYYNEHFSPWIRFFEGNSYAPTRNVYLYFFNFRFMKSQLRQFKI